MNRWWESITDSSSKRRSKSAIKNIKQPMRKKIQKMNKNDQPKVVKARKRTRKYKMRVSTNRKEISIGIKRSL